ncbi:MAG TPA: glycosyl transferase [Candidatus Lokiarchaeia archaeon]|nr:glycosyl transferase [Candidatus Lokiarchaeia archaeon]
MITRPDTPTPWINYLTNSEYCAIISNTGGGYSFHQDPKDRRILRYRYNNLCVDRPGRYFYIRDTQSKKYWSPTWQPVLKKLDYYECRHGLGYTKINSSYSGIHSDITYFVPLHENLEIWRLILKNEGNTPRNLFVFTYAEFCLWRALNDQNDLQYIQNTADCYFDNSIIFYSLFDRTPGYAFFSSNVDISSYDCDRESFIGPYRSESNPLGVVKGRCFNSRALGGNPVAATCCSIELPPLGEKSFIFMLGVAKTKSEAIEVVQKFQDLKTSEDALSAIAESWKRYLKTCVVDTPDPDFNLLINVWNPYQCKITFDWSRYASFYETGIGRGMGFRDSNQDTMAINAFLPVRVRQRLLDLAKNQFESGMAYHIYFPLTGKGDFPDYAKSDMRFFSDDHLWLILAVWDYIKETGDLSILQEEVPFVDGTIASLYIHLMQAINFTLSHLGAHNLPLLGSADWNDALHLPGPNNAAESVWVAMQFHKALLDLSELAEVAEKNGDAEQFKQAAAQIRTTINDVGWDGHWYIRAFADNGDTIGGDSCFEGKIYLNPQSWAILSSVAPPDRAVQCLNSVQAMLDTKYGVMLLTPPYTRFSPDLGGISTFPPGLKENGAIFCHANPWLIIAECILGRGDRAFHYYKQLSPMTKIHLQDIHWAEPYVFSQMITGKNHPKFGQAKNSWLTGTAAWSFKSATQAILGVRPEFHGLLVDPCIPAEWGGFHVLRCFRDSTYDIRVKNPNHVQKGVKSVEIKGVSVDSNLLPILPRGKKYDILITMG